MVKPNRPESLLTCTLLIRDTDLYVSEMNVVHVYGIRCVYVTILKFNTFLFHALSNYILMSF